MSSHSEIQIFYCDLETAAKACRFVFKEMQLVVKRDSGRVFEANEQFKLASFTNPAKLKVDLSSDGIRTSIDVKISNVGFGPIQGGHVRRVAEMLFSSIRLQLSKNSESKREVREKTNFSVDDLI